MIILCCINNEPNGRDSPLDLMLGDTDMKKVYVNDEHGVIKVNNRLFYYDHEDTDVLDMIKNAPDTSKVFVTYNIPEDRMEEGQEFTIKITNNYNSKSITKTVRHYGDHDYMIDKLIFDVGSIRKKSNI